MEEVEGIVLNELNYGETSKIINVFTKEYGVIGMMAKGARTLKSKLRSNTTKLTYGTFNIYYKPDKLSILSSVDVIDNFKNIKIDIEKISYASYLVDLASQISKQVQDENVYDLLISALNKINEDFNPLVITNILELKYLDYLGIMPMLDACAICGSTKSIATISSDKGGYVCNNCLTNEPLVTEKTIKLIRMFYYVDLDKITKMEISLQSQMEINSFLTDYYDRWTGLYLKTKDFLQTLDKLK